MSVSLEHLDQQHHAACLILVFYNLTLITHTHTHTFELRLNQTTKNEQSLIKQARLAVKNAVLPL